MFFAEDRIEHMRAMILATTEKDRRAALKKLLPMQRADFVGLFKAMGPLPVTIRTLDPPLHEFLPKREDLLVEIARLEATKPRSPKLKALRPLLARVEELHEANPMLGLRGCRLGISFPEITEMQARAIIEAAVVIKKKGGDPHLGNHDSAHRHHRGDAQPGRHRPPRRRGGLPRRRASRWTTWSAP